MTTLLEIIAAQGTVSRSIKTAVKEKVDTYPVIRLTIQDAQIENLNTLKALKEPPTLPLHSTAKKDEYIFIYGRGRVKR